MPFYFCPKCGRAQTGKARPGLLRRLTPQCPKCGVNLHVCGLRIMLGGWFVAFLLAPILCPEAEMSAKLIFCISTAIGLFEMARQMRVRYLFRKREQPKSELYLQDEQMTT